MNLPNDENLDTLNNNDIIRKIINIQNILIMMSDSMVVLKNKNKILDEENEKLQIHINSIVNEIKKEAVQNFGDSNETLSNNLVLKNESGMGEELGGKKGRGKEIVKEEIVKEEIVKEEIAKEEMTKKEMTKKEMTKKEMTKKE
ncbi:conserved protein, unknown function, partial [Hepatocystis sp. ex Piliocolobus tephrosceles]